MTIRVAIRHLTDYHFDRAVTLGPHILRLKPAPHTRTCIESYSLRIAPAGHFINWQQDAYSNHLARVVFPEAPNHKLGTLASFLKLPHPPTHRALADCFTTMEVLNAMAARKKSHQAVTLTGRRYDL